MTPVSSGFGVTTDPLHLMAAEAQDLLHRVDLVIEHLGVPPGHPLLDLLRSLRVRPGEALSMLLAAPVGPLLDAVAQLRRLAAAYADDLVAPLDRQIQRLGWGGAGQQAFAAHWDTLRRHLTGGPGGDDPNLVDRLHATADFVESAAGWFSQTRQAVAAALAEGFRSAEAVTLRTCDPLADGPEAVRRGVVTGELGDPDRLVRAAANLGVTVLAPVAEYYEAGVAHFLAGADGVPAGGWPDRLADLPAPPPPDADAVATKTWIKI